MARRIDISYPTILQTADSSSDMAKSKSTVYGVSGSRFKYGLRTKAGGARRGMCKRIMVLPCRARGRGYPKGSTHSVTGQ